MARRSRSRQRVEELRHERDFASGRSFNTSAPFEPDPVLEDEAPEPRPNVVAGPRSNRRPGFEEPVYFYDLLAARRGDLTDV